MSYHTEHQRLKPVLDLARQLDIATNPEAKAIFEAGNCGFQVWCTPYDHPQGWNGINMHSWRVLQTLRVCGQCDLEMG